MPLSPLAGKPAPSDVLIDVDRLVAAYHDRRPDPANPRERVAFGTSGHRGAPEDTAFNEAHILAITQAIVEHRARAGITGPLFLGAEYRRIETRYASGSVANNHLNLSFGFEF